MSLPKEGEMQDYLKRMLIEKKDLDGKIKRAKKAVAQPPFGMNKTQIMMLAEQVKYMCSYRECLAERIDYEKEKNVDD